jgi:cobalt/nickel transport system permease protein
MAKNSGAFFDFNYLDILAGGDTPIHRIDPRAKLIITIFFIVTVVSSGKYEVSSLLPFFFFPAVMVSLGGLPVRYIAAKILFLSPFILFVAIFNPVFDTTPFMHFGQFAVSGGWISFFSIIIRFVLTVGAAFILVATTGFSEVCMASEKLGLPKVFAVQMLFLYRYIFVLGEEATRVSRARELRSFGKRGKEPRVFASIVGNLLLRTWDRAQRIHTAMLCRGFRGEFHFRRPLGMGVTEAVFMGGWTAFFILCRTIDSPAFIGRIFTEVLR